MKNRQPSRQPQNHESVKPQAAQPPNDDDDDSQGAADFERTHVHKVYDDIAPHFSATRHTPWPPVVSFLEEEEGCCSQQDDDPGGFLLDVGCGNGKYLRGHGSHGYAFGMDTCADLVNVTSSSNDDDGNGNGNGRMNTHRHVDVGVADVLHIPMRDNTFDTVICIAVIHHLCTRARRIAALRECVRVLKPNGKALFSVWAQRRKFENGNENDENGDGAKFKMMNRRFDAQDMLVPWHLRKKRDGAASERIREGWHQVYHRFYHVYKEGELEMELQEIQGVSIVKSYYELQNLGVIIQKMAPTQAK